ncbi:hypothetical protein TL16_g05068 [Triparma laevis f. inornata]|uniref:Uncharacterized protein n=1 Tax=Triparma laevis f. inornata TaxID=1714386 RepID=A0A9W7E5K1_9STRA|nr:hypothetical protein TL16_g05068 [Triparma laevis f. inornata]
MCPNPTPPAPSAWTKYQARQSRKKVEKSGDLKRRKDIDSKRKFITYPVFIFICGMVMIFGIYTVYYPLKKRYYKSENGDADKSSNDSAGPFTVLSMLSERHGWDEAGTETATTATTANQPIKPQNLSLQTLVAYNETVLKSLKDVGNLNPSNKIAAQYDALLRESEVPFDLFLYNFVSGGIKLKNFNSNHALETLNHFNTVLKYSQQPNVTSTFIQLQQNSTYNSLTLQSCLKYIDIVIICLNKGCSGFKDRVKSDIVSNVYNVVKVGNGVSGYTVNKTDGSVKFLNARYDWEASNRNWKEATKINDDIIEFELERLPKKWMIGERVIRSNTDHIARLYTRSCVNYFSMGEISAARDSCGKGMESSEFGMNVECFLVAGEVERYVGNMTYAVRFYERAMAMQTMKESNKIEEESLGFGTSAEVIGERLGNTLKDMGKDSEAEEYFKLIVGAGIKMGREIEVGGSYMNLGRMFLRTRREDEASNLFSTALRLNSEAYPESPISGWTFALGLADAAAGEFGNAHAKLTTSIEVAERDSSDDRREYKSLSSAIHALPTCPVVDMRLRDLSLLLNGLRKANETKCMVKSYFVPEEYHLMKKADLESPDGIWSVRNKYSDYEFTAPNVSVVKTIAGDKASMSKRHFVASKEISPKKVISTLKSYALVSGSWPLPRVYVHSNSTTVKDGAKKYDTYGDWVNEMVSGGSDGDEFDDVELNVQGEVVFGEEKDDLFRQIRERNFEKFWKDNVKNLGRVFESAFEAEVGKWVKKEEKKVIYGVDYVVYEDEIKKQEGFEGFMNPVVTKITGVDNQMKDFEVGWGEAAEREHIVKRSKDFMILMAGSVVDRGMLEMIRTKEITPDRVGERELSQRLSWSVQEVTKLLCPLLYKHKTEKNVKKVYDGEGGGEEDFERFGCDQEKLGFLAMELTIATMEWERRRGFELVWPLKKVVVEEDMEEVDREAGIMRNMFVKWVGVKEKEKLKDEKRRRRKKEGL